MNTATVDAHGLHVEPHGLDKMWSLTGRLDIPLAHVVDAARAPEAIDQPKGMRFPGLALGEKFAGTFSRDGERSLWNVRGGSDIVRVDLTDEH